jgi:hypothetical protein
LEFIVFNAGTISHLASKANIGGPEGSQEPLLYYIVPVVTFSRNKKKETYASKGILE